MTISDQSFHGHAVRLGMPLNDPAQHWDGVVEASSQFGFDLGAFGLRALPLGLAQDGKVSIDRFRPQMWVLPRKSTVFGFPSPFSQPPVLSHFWNNRRIRRSAIRCSTSSLSQSRLMVPKNPLRSASSTQFTSVPTITRGQNTGGITPITRMDGWIK